MYPIDNKKIKRRLLRNLDRYLADNTNAWELSADGSYELLRPADGDEPNCAQLELLAEYAETS